jgi:hypothetical protein
VERRYLKVVGKTYKPLPGSGPGRATDWQNAKFPHSRAFFVELPLKKLSPADIRRHIRAVLAVAAMNPAAS